MSFRPLLLALPLAFVTVAGLALASPASALDSAADDPFELAQATPSTPPPPPPGAGPERRGDRPVVNPKAFCLDQIARRASNRTYIKIRMELKPEQMTTWNAFAKASDDADVKDMARCNALPSEMKERPSYIERLTLEEGAMKARVARIDAVKPSLVAFYDTLSPEQKAVLDRPRGAAGGMAGRGPGHRWQR